jgi:hypothetical protein
VDETDFLFLLGHGGHSLMVGRACGVFVAEEFHIATKWDRRNLPAGAVAIIEADNFGTKADREGERLDAAPAGDQKMSKFMEKNDDGQNEQKGDNVAGKSAAERGEAAHDVEMHRYPRPAPVPAFRRRAS